MNAVTTGQIDEVASGHSRLILCSASWIGSGRYSSQRVSCWWWQASSWPPSPG